MDNLTNWRAAGVKFIDDPSGSWSEASLQIAGTGLEMIEARIGDHIQTKRALGLINGVQLPLHLCRGCRRGGAAHVTAVNFGVSARITFDELRGPITLTEFIHEVGHVVDSYLGDGSGFWSKQVGFVGLGWDHITIQHDDGTISAELVLTDPTQPSNSAVNVVEDFADTFTAWVYGQNRLPHGWTPITPERDMVLRAALQFLN